jgi:hypothetical protein
MTTKHVVADEVLGKIAKRFWELMRRIMEGSVNPDRALNLLQLSLEGVSKTQSSSKTYILESEWVWDHSHHEYATITLENYESETSFEDILGSSISKDRTNYLLDLIKTIFDKQVPKHGSFKMLRLYRVIDCSFQSQITNDKDVDLHFVMKPLFDFDTNENPIPCSFK